MKSSTNLTDKIIFSEHAFEVVSCENFLYVHKGIVDAYTTIAKLTDDDTGHEYHSKNVVYVYGDSWYCFELEDSILAGRTFSGVFIVGGEEHAFSGKAVNSPPSSDGTEEKKSSSRLKSLIPAVVIAVFLIVFAIIVLGREPSAPTGETEPSRQEGASPEVQNKNDSNSVNTNTTLTEKESTNASSVVNNDTRVLKNEIESDSDNRLGNIIGDTGKEQNAAFEEQPNVSSFVMDNPLKTTGKQDDVKGDVSTSVAGGPQPSENGMENVKMAEITETIADNDRKGRLDNHMAQENDKKANHGTVQPPELPNSALNTILSNTNIQNVKSVKRPKASPLTKEQANLRDNGEYSITNEMDLKNLDKIDQNGRKDIVLVFCPDRYAKVSPQDYENKWEILTSKVNEMLEGTIKKVQVIKPQRLDLVVPDRASLKEGIEFDVVELQ